MKRSSPVYVALFVAALALPQATAFIQQFRLGFRPLGRAPVRVPLSWDMFAERIERCTVRWTPAVRTPLGTMSSVGDLSPRLEWDIVSDSAAGYEAWARWGCRFAGAGTRADLLCLYPDGRKESDAIACP